MSVGASEWKRRDHTARGEQHRGTGEVEEDSVHGKWNRESKRRLGAETGQGVVVGVVGVARVAQKRCEFGMNWREGCNAMWGIKLIDARIDRIG